MKLLPEKLKLSLKNIYKTINFLLGIQNIEKEKQCKVVAIKAAGSVLKAKYENQPQRIVYRIHHWW